MKRLKRFLIFARFDYYPDGGWKDLIGQADTREEAMKVALNRKEYAGPGTWWHIVDTQIGEIIAESLL